MSAARPVVALVNASRCVADADVAALLPALQLQVTRDLAPAWSLPGADLIFVEDKRVQPPAGAWVLAILDDSDQAGALGYHDMTAAGLPMGKAFARTDLEYGEDWRITVSHELLELLVDPTCTSFAAVTYKGRSAYTVKEACDAVESDDLAYEIDGQKVSDFVLPAFFDTVTAHPPGTKFDFAGAVTAPMTIAPGGYLSLLDPAGGTGWSLVYGDRVPMHKRRPPPGSRRERFLVGHHRWKRSTGI